MRNALISSLGTDRKPKGSHKRVNALITNGHIWQMYAKPADLEV